MLRKIRKENKITVKEIAKKLDVDVSTIYYLEQGKNPSSIMLTRYLEKLEIPDEHRDIIKAKRKSNWKYDVEKSPITNELIRIRNGLGRTAFDLSKILGKYETYWVTLEGEGIPLTDDDLDMLDRVFRISSTTLRRHRLAIERDKDGLPMEEEFQLKNSEITEPHNLYDHQKPIDSAETMLITLELEEEYGSIVNVPESEPRLQELRNILGVIYYDA